MKNFDIKINWTEEAPMADPRNIRLVSMNEVEHHNVSMVVDDLFIKFGDPSCTVTWSGVPMKINAADDVSCMIVDFIFLANWLMCPDCESEFSLSIQGFNVTCVIELLGEEVKFSARWLEFPDYLDREPENTVVVDRIELTESIKKFLLEIENMLYLNGSYYFPLSFVCRYV